MCWLGGSGPDPPQLWCSCQVSVVLSQQLSCFHCHTQPCSSLALTHHQLSERLPAKCQAPLASLPAQLSGRSSAPAPWSPITPAPVQWTEILIGVVECGATSIIMSRATIASLSPTLNGLAKYEGWRVLVIRNLHAIITPHHTHISQDFLLRILILFLSETSQCPRY